jgi:hypothetical protein
MVRLNKNAPYYGWYIVIACNFVALMTWGADAMGSAAPRAPRYIIRGRRGPDRVGWVLNLMTPREGTHLHLLTPRDV